jgi:hypothetical protein
MRLFSGDVSGHRCLEIDKALMKLPKTEDRCLGFRIFCFVRITDSIESVMKLGMPC